MTDRIQQWIQVLENLDCEVQKKKAAANGPQKVITNDTHESSI